MKSPHSARPRWSIFCKLVDNFGDIGVCWRLARILALHHGKRVRLWIDDLQALQKILPKGSLQCNKRLVDGVEIRPWEAPYDDLANDDVVVEAFGCELPAHGLAAMASRSVPPMWVNLEYLTAESWISGCHRMQSPHPKLPLMKHFFFPGFTSASGGLLREPGLLSARDALQRNAPDRADVLAQAAGYRLPDEAIAISLFAYEQPDLHRLLQIWSAGDQPIAVLVPEGRVVADVARHFGAVNLTCGEMRERGALQVVVVPFSDQDSYDRLLWACDINFVRGEDSFVRAQWAARPFVWQIYVQQENAHEAKLEAFLDLFCKDLDASTAVAVRDFWRAWNGLGDLSECWAALAAEMPAFADHCRKWSDRLSGQTDLARALVDFCEKGV